MNRSYFIFCFTWIISRNLYLPSLTLQSFQCFLYWNGENNFENYSSLNLKMHPQPFLVQIPFYTAYFIHVEYSPGEAPGPFLTQDFLPVVDFINTEGFTANPTPDQGWFFPGICRGRLGENQG